MASLRFGAVDSTGAPKEVEADETDLLATASAVLRGAVYDSGLWRVQGVFTRTNVLLVLMLTTLAWVNPEDVFQDYGPFMALVVNPSLSPSVDMVLVWFEDMTAAEAVDVPIEWLASASMPQKRRMAGKMIHLLNTLLTHLRSQKEQNSGADTELPAAVQSSSTTEWKRCYSDAPPLSELPNMLIMGRIHGAVTSRRLGLIELRKCTAADEVPVSSLAQAVVDRTTGTISYKQREKSANITKPQNFMKALSLLMNGFAFVCITVMAETTQWSGDALQGVVRGARRLFTKADGEFYLKYWSDVAFSGLDVPKLIELEAKCRKLWADPFMNMVRLGCCLRASVTEIKGEVASALSTMQYRKMLKFPGGGGGGGRARPGGLGDTPEKKSRLEVAESKTGFKKHPTHQKTADGKEICKFWVDGRKCNFGANCKRVHNYCDWDVDGKPCGGDHKRSEHPW